MAAIKNHVARIAADDMRGDGDHAGGIDQVVVVDIAAEDRDVVQPVALFERGLCPVKTTIEFNTNYEERPALPEITRLLPVQHPHRHRESGRRPGQRAAQPGSTHR